MSWTPASGAAALSREHPEFVGLLRELLAGRQASSELAADPTMIPILQGIGGNHALNLLRDPSGARLAYWPRVWAARALATVGDPTCAEALRIGSQDAQWRVRMQSVRAAGLIAAPETVDEIAARLVADANVRVRQAAALAVGRNGTERSLPALDDLRRDRDVRVRRAAEQAIDRLQRRLS